jgi:hypothetical protein
MIHVGMLREKQVEVIEAFKQRYLARFGGPLRCSCRARALAVALA